MALADKQLPPGVTRQDECFWTQDTDGPWYGSCGAVWEFIDGGPKDNDAYFCPLCGGVLLTEPFLDDETQNERMMGPNAQVTGSAPTNEERRLDALRCAPIAMVDTRDALCLCAPTEEAFPALYALQGKFVALVEVSKFSPNLSVMLNNKELP